jgi:hypothetical protein
MKKVIFAIFVMGVAVGVIFLILHRYNSVINIISDTGKACFQRSDCKDECLYRGDKPKTDDDGYLVGYCGHADLSICFEQLLITKTKKVSDLISHGCS